MLKIIQSVANDKQMKVTEVDSHEILASSDEDAGEMLRTLFAKRDDHKNIIVINHIDSLLHSGSTVACRKKACALNIAAVDEYVR